MIFCAFSGVINLKKVAGEGKVLQYSSGGGGGLGFFF